MNTNSSLRLLVTFIAALCLTAGPVFGQTISNNFVGTTLTFDPVAGDLVPVPDTYGDRVTSILDAFGNRYGPGSGGTSNITVTFGPAGSHVRKAQGPYGNLLNVACQEDGDFAELDAFFEADPGYEIMLHRFDVAALADEVLLPRAEVIDQNGAVLWSVEDAIIPGFRGTRARMDFTAAPLAGQALRLRLDLSSLGNTDSHLVGIDNIVFSQRVGTGCPRGARLTITPQRGGTALLTWSGTGFRLETCSAIGGRWSTLGIASPVTVSTTNGFGFFRLACP